ncbi:META domain-containing protein [Alisedimentitalea sp. MJ-SS2]|uniref:META domain-containing protein n=1 Tax=Aliisedimentitalea sp. MJ-SS2 TaxID=3049795 RepID=UPI002908A1E0|nr:META domain-containing protein [Alisedimentitalea sp. MJ-SS2]MDU8929530.1 META domain-containing protein [Alisedimentitalea sp. MJ-SS2]
MIRLALVLALLAQPIMAHKNHSPYDAPDRLWQLVELNGKPFTDRALLRFPRPGRIEGQAPCNRFVGTMRSAYPWFKAEEIAATRMACPALQAETLFLQSLGKMTTAEIGENELSLRGEDGQVMRFTPAKPDE